MKTMLLPAFRMLGVMTLLTGVAYPLLITLAANALFPAPAGGSLVRRDGQVVGSRLLAQNFTNSAWFWPRPSAADFATTPSGASNLGPTSGALWQAAQQRAAAFRAAHRLPPETALPADVVFTSGSGLDPHLSPAAVRLQILRVAEARRYSPAQRRRLAELIEQFIEPPQAGFLGEPRINILLLNLALDRLQ